DLELAQKHGVESSFGECGGLGRQGGAHALAEAELAGSLCGRGKERRRQRDAGVRLAERAGEQGGEAESSSCEANAKQLDGPREPAAQGRLAPAELPGGLLLGLAFEVTEEHWPAETIREPGQLLVERRVQFAHGHVGGFGGWHGGSFAF